MTEGTTSRHPLLVWAWSLVRLDFVGIPAGALFFCLSLTPSLLPRDWLFAGLIGGINAAIGYGIGVLIRKIMHRFVLRHRSWWPPSASTLRIAKVVVVAGALTVPVLTVIPAARWQRQVSALMGIEGPTTLSYLRTLLLAVLVGAACIAVWRVLADLVKLIARMLIRRWRLHSEVAFFIGTAIIAVLFVMMVNGVLYRGFLLGASQVFQPQNSTSMAGVTQPLEPEKSGSPTSFASWDSLGYQGRNFVAGGPDAAELTRLNGAPALEPIRVYAGLQTADTDESRMAVLLSELERTGAFDRELLVIIPTTGTGWVNPVAARAVESMYNGDTALVGMQYSYLPSWISFLGDRQKSIESARMMVDGIHRRWSERPENDRPKLVLYGESLGSYAGQGAFGWLPDIAEMDFSGVLWVGPPHESSLWSGLVRRRDPGTPEVEPRYDNGSTVLQHASDPIVWWSPNLLFSRPDWLREPPGADRTASMRWYPIVTFWQVSADMTNAAGVPEGHGHNYSDTVLDGLVAVAAPDGWTPADTERIRADLDSKAGVDGPEV
ncbi:MAG: rane protein [Mycobacterium sp.]|nr:rane protein [Mycobacterium sp.]